MKISIVFFTICSIGFACDGDTLVGASQAKTVAIVHHHLRAGGVTRVMENAVYALEKAGVKSVIVVGEAPSASTFAHRNVVVMPELHYADVYSPEDVPGWLARLDRSVRDILGASPDVWHFHNPTLGKNVGYSALVSLMARRGYPLVLQIHDFAEDGRPANYQRLVSQWREDVSLEEGLYPLGPNVAYTVLNGRDYQRLLSSGVPQSQLYFLPNPVWFEPLSLKKFFSRPSNFSHLYLYPTRAIRRKNIGEFLFWSAIAEKGKHFATTLAPVGGAERVVYEEWVNFAQKLKLPVTFEAGKTWQLQFDELLAHADTFVTTSVAEGFGLAFLEPWLAGKPIWGRDLPEITSDFKKTGVQLPGLYTRLHVPIQILGKDRLLKLLDAELNRYLTAYGKPYSAEIQQRAHQAWIIDDTVDFGILSEELQKEVILAVENGKLAREAYALCDQAVDPSLLEANASILRSTFGLDRYGERLIKIYDQVAPGDRSHAYVSAQKVLGAFLAPNGFCLLRN